MNPHSPFDVFLAHSSLDKTEVRKIAVALKQRNLTPWLDEEQIPPGRPFQDEIQKAISVSNSAAICIGKRGLGRWQSWELRTLISQCVKKGIPVIPVLLPGVESLPEHLLFLEQFRWVEFLSIDDAHALHLLEWGITQQKPNTTTTKEPQAPLDDLSSEKGVDYTRLRDLLKAQNWRAADEKTLNVMLQAAVTKSQGYLDYDSIENFPCTDLRTIDQLWVKYSNGHFGFSVQKRIWLQCGGKVDIKTERALGDALGWRKNNSWLDYKDITFTLNAPEGHLPVGFLRVIIGDRSWSSSLASRLVKCNI